MKIDRTIQREILEILARHHPNPLTGLSAHLNGYTKPQLVSNSLYLAEYGLIKTGFEYSECGLTQAEWADENNHSITAKGLDFLMDDGGLGAILGVVTVKLDADSIKALIITRIDKAEGIKHEERSLLKNLLRTAGDQTLRKLLDMSLEAGLKAGVSASQLIGMLQGPNG